MRLHTWGFELWKAKKNNKLLHKELHIHEEYLLITALIFINHCSVTLWIHSMRNPIAPGVNIPAHTTCHCHLELSVHFASTKPPPSHLVCHMASHSSNTFFSSVMAQQTKGRFSISSTQTNSVGWRDKSLLHGCGHDIWATGVEVLHLQLWMVAPLPVHWWPTKPVTVTK